MDTYQTIKQAIIDHVCLTANYKGNVRHFSPHALGSNDEGEINVMTYQYGGYSNTKLPYDGDWRCFQVNLLQDVRRNDDQWHTKNDHSKRNRCVTRVDIQVK